MEREAAGIVHLLLAESLKRTPLAALSRPVAGTVGNTLVVTLPGSVKAVKENLEALFANGFIEHAIDLIRGGTGKQVHAAMGSGHGGVPHHHHHHHHDHHVPQPRAILSHDPSLPGMFSSNTWSASKHYAIINSLCSSSRFTISANIPRGRFEYNRE